MRDLGLNRSLSTVLFGAPPGALAEIPAHLSADALSEADTEAMALWLESQEVCGQILREHGDAGLDRLLHQTAISCARYGIRMPPRVRSTAIWYEVPIP